MNIVEKYLTGLRKVYFENNCEERWQNFESVIHGANEENIDKLKQLYSEVPNALIAFLQYVDGTYWRKFGEETIAFFIIGSDIYEYPYYLLSSQEMIDHHNQAKVDYVDLINREYDDVEIDDRITDKVDEIDWLHFSDCMNNGGTSQLFIDFSPSEKGKKGQIVRFIHDPDELKVIADSFEDYLQKLMDNGYNFINEDIIS